MMLKQTEFSNYQFQSTESCSIIKAPYPLSLSLSLRNPLNFSHSYPLSLLCFTFRMPSSSVFTHPLIRAHFPEGQRTIV